MQNISFFKLFLILLTFNSTALCMLATKLCRAKGGARYKTYSYNDIQQGRRDAYQRYCPIKITWRNEDITQKRELQQNTHTKEDAMAFYKQFMQK